MSVAVKSESADAGRAERVRITEIFHSIQGESTRVGLPTVFVRLTGCPLRCQYCDTPYAFHGGSYMSLDEVQQTVAGYGAHYVTVTGGEPLAQPGCELLLERLADAGYRVSLETSGAMDIAGVDPRVVTVLDLKTPGSGEARRNRWDNLQCLKPADQVKFVICHREDYDWAKSVLARGAIPDACEILFSPSHGQLAPETLADWILGDGLPVRLQLQLHKYLWGDVPGR